MVHGIAIEPTPSEWGEGWGGGSVESVSLFSGNSLVSTAKLRVRQPVSILLRPLIVVCHRAHYSRGLNT